MIAQLQEITAEYNVNVAEFVVVLVSEHIAGYAAIYAYIAYSDSLLNETFIQIAYEVFETYGERRIIASAVYGYELVEKRVEFIYLMPVQHTQARIIAYY